MTRYLPLVLAACFNFSLLFSQWEVNEQTSIGGNDDINLQKIIPSPDGGFYTLSTTMSDGDVGNLEVEKYGLGYALIVKYDSYFSIEWMKSIGGTQNDIATSMLALSDGILIGLTSNSPTSGNKTVNGFGDSDYWLVKLNFDGDIVWQKSFGGNKEDYLRDIIEVDDGFLLIGDSESDISGTKSSENNGTRDVWVVKTTTDGDMLWDKSIGGSESERIRSAQKSENKIYFVGPSSSNTSGDKSNDNINFFDLWLVCMNLEGEIIWDRTISTGESISLAEIAVSESDVFVGVTSSSQIENMREIPLKGDRDIWVANYSKDGDYIKQFNFGAANLENLGKLAVFQENKILVLSSSNSDISIDKTANGFGDFDYWVLLSDSDGNVIIDQTIGGLEMDLPREYALVGDKLVIGGISYSAASGNKTTEKIGDASSFDTWIISLDTNTLEVIEQPSIKFNVYPNPTSDELKVIISNDNEVQNLSLHDSTGKIMWRSEEVKNETYIDLSLFPAGVYYLNATNHGRSTLKKVVKH